jgi:hypothetical protein
MAESKSDKFANDINAHSEKIAKFDPLSTNRLAPDSECAYDDERLIREPRQSSALAVLTILPLLAHSAAATCSSVKNCWRGGVGFLPPYFGKPPVLLAYRLVPTQVGSW